MLGILTIICGIVVLRTLETDGAQIGNRVERRALIDTVSLGKHVHMIEHLEHGGRWLMDGANYCPALPGQSLQQLDGVQ